jgi:Tol biopolymer transport system component
LGGDVWVVDAARGTNVRITFDASQENASPIWSPDGARIAFASLRSGKWGLYQKASSGAASDELLTQSDVPIAPTSWAHDGRFIVYRAIDPKTTFDLMNLPLSGDRKPTPLLQTSFIESHGQISPDGKWLAYMSSETSRTEIYVIPFPGGAGKWQVSTNGGIWPRWRQDGNELFYFQNANSGLLMASEIKATAGAFESAVPTPLFEHRYSSGGGGHPAYEYLAYAVSPDGQRFLIPRQASTLATENQVPPQIAVVLNWPGGLRK